MEQPVNEPSPAGRAVVIAPVVVGALAVVAIVGMAPMQYSKMGGGMGGMGG